MDKAWKELNLAFYHFTEWYNPVTDIKYPKLNYMKQINLITILTSTFSIGNRISFPINQSQVNVPTNMTQVIGTPLSDLMTSSDN